MQSLFHLLSPNFECNDDVSINLYKLIYNAHSENPEKLFCEPHTKRANLLRIRVKSSKRVGVLWKKFEAFWWMSGCCSSPLITPSALKGSFFRTTKSAAAGRKFCFAERMVTGCFGLQDVFACLILKWSYIIVMWNDALERYWEKSFVKIHSPVPDNTYNSAKDCFFEKKLIPIALALSIAHTHYILYNASMLCTHN